MKQKSGGGAHCGDSGASWSCTTSQAPNHSHSIPSDIYSHTIRNTGGSETRPVNVAMFYLIKY